ncbi:uncharacterized protein LOC143905912 [Temnothorax americanus]|uniref:uncharacterized protein LOC143905912 n=1 Tax=Temnothorax americanus TaxID=1964332 RepID=UPI004068B695
MRIIVSALGSPLYNVARFMHDILQESIPKPRSHIKDSWSFVRRIVNYNIDTEEILISLDVTALFTNIPKDLVCEGVRKRWHHISQYTKLNLAQFLYAIELILQSTSFGFDGQFYEQIFGSPMGSPLSPILADIVMEDLETYCISHLNFEIPVFLRYVDDIFAIVPRNAVETLLEVFNNYHPRLQFTYETKVGGSILFLDTLVIRDGDRLITNWHRKPTFLGRYINFFSNHPHKYKINTITSLVDRAILLSDDWFHHANIKIVKDILTNNCFPIKLVNKFIYNKLLQLKNRKDSEVGGLDVSFDARKHITIPYIKDLSEGICRTLKNVGLKALYTIPKKLNSVIKRGKDRLTMSKETNVVYQIDCVNCEASYIGQTKRHLETRIKEHFNDIKKHCSNHSVVSKHRSQNNHDFKWSEPKILHKECNTKKREIAEMFFIKRHNNIINL